MARKKAKADATEPATAAPAGSILDQLWNDLAGAPEDWKLRGVVADWYEDNGRTEEAACLRWMIKQKKRPYHGSEPKASWFNLDKIQSGLGDPESDLPGELFGQLEGGKAVANHMTFDSLRAAEEALMSGWTKAKKKGWKAKE